MKSNRKHTGIAVWAWTLAAALVCTGCGAKSMADVRAANGTALTEGYYEAESFAAPEMEGLNDAVAEEAAENSLSQPTDGRKVILSASASLETQAYDAALAGLLQAVQQAGGYVASRSEYNYDTLSCQLMLRIPSERFDSFLAGLSGIANVTDLSQSSEDITDSYIQTESYLESLQTQQARLLELMEQAETLEDLLTIEERLAEVRAQLQYYDSLKNSYDSRLSYAEVAVSLREVTEYTLVQPTFGERIIEALRGSGKGVVNFIQQAIIFLIYAVPVMAVIAIPVAAVIFGIRQGKKHRAARKGKATAPTAETTQTKAPSAGE